MVINIQSNGGSEAITCSKFPKDNIIESEANLGFADGKYIGIQFFHKTRNLILLAPKWYKGIDKLLSPSYLVMVAFRDLSIFYFNAKFYFLESGQTHLNIL